MSTASRRIWLTAGAAVGLFALAGGALAGLDVLAAERRTETLDLPDLAGVRRVRVEGDGGSVTVTGTDERTITGTVELRSGVRRAGHAERIEGDTLVLRSSCPALFSVVCHVRFDLRIPKGMELEADVSGGGVSARGLTGRVSIDSSGGGITLTDVTGDADLDSSGGGITVSGGSGRVLAESSGGSVRLRDSEAATVDLRSSGGGITASFRRAPQDVRADSSGGDVTVELPDGPEPYRVDAESSGGSSEVRVRTAPDGERAVTAHSSGGDVTVRYAPG